MAAATTRHACPVCDFELEPGVQKCPNCTTDLRLFAAPVEMAQEFYNEGLDLARAGDRAGALEKMHGALAADPRMVDAYIVAGKLMAQSGTAAELEQAIACWEKARGFRPTGDQSRKLDNCIETADASLRRLEQEAHARRRTTIGGLIAGGVLVAAACGVAGYFLRPARPAEVKIIQVPPGKDRELQTPDNPVEAVTRALNRPDITVTDTGEKLSLAGKVASDSEKRMTISAAAFAAKRPESAVDGTGLTVKPIFRSVAGRRVEHMLHLFVGSLKDNRADPLYGANFVVSGGIGNEPLEVNGTCFSPKAGPEIVRLVKEVYPSANPVDVTGLKTIVPRRAVRPVVKDERPVSKSNHTRTVRRRVDHAPIARSTASYTVQPGDSIYHITQKYGHGMSEWHTLYEANRKTIKNPDSIPAGTVLKLPPGWQFSEKTEGNTP